MGNQLCVQNCVFCKLHRIRIIHSNDKIYRHQLYNTKTFMICIELPHLHKNALQKLRSTASQKTLNCFESYKNDFMVHVLRKVFRGRRPEPLDSPEQLSPRCSVLPPQQRGWSSSPPHTRPPSSWLDHCTPLGIHRSAPNGTAEADEDRRTKTFRDLTQQFL